MKRHEEAIVLGLTNYGEADRVVTLFGRDSGKLMAIARGARKSKRRFGAGLALFGIGEAALDERPGREMAVLESFHATAVFSGLISDIAKVAHGSYSIELVRELIPARQTELAVFRLLLRFLGLLEAEAASSERLRVFELHLLEAIGLRPQVDQCIVCGTQTLDALGQVFDGERGGVICGGCRGRGVRLPADARRALVQAQALSLENARELRLSPSTNIDCRDALMHLISGHLGKTLKSVEFINKLNRADG